MSNEYLSAEHDRMLGGMILPCVVVAVDLAAARVRVQSAGWTSAWVRWHAQAAGVARHWRAPSLGEQGVLLSPSGQVAMGTFVPGLYGGAQSAPDNRDYVESWSFPDGAVLAYDWQAHRYAIALPAGSIELQVGATQVLAEPGSVTVNAAAINLQGAVQVQGNLAVQGNITSSGSILDTAGNSNHHTH
ncbi:MAG: hypothetical protein GAK36_00213 [Pseudomonas sp.]|nr:MAG: hypothetical protein GAK36_00213 [Pseudomonas sp.]